MVISDRQMGHPQLAAKSGALSRRLMHSCSAMDRQMEHAEFHTIAFLAFSCPAISCLAFSHDNKYIGCFVWPYAVNSFDQSFQSNVVQQLFLIYLCYIGNFLSNLCPISVNYPDFSLSEFGDSRFPCRRVDHKPLCVCVLVTRVSSAKSAEQTEMPCWPITWKYTLASPDEYD